MNHQFITAAMLLVSLNMLSPSLAADDPSEAKVTFDEHIKPIFREHCASCHSESDKESDLALDTFAGSLAGGSSGAVIAEGSSGGSRLFKLLTHAERPFMPPDQDPIPKEQIELVKIWIEQGTPENAGSKIKRNNSAAAAMLSTSTLGQPEGPPPMPTALLLQPVTETERSAAIAAMAASPWAPLVVVGGQEQVSCYHAESGELLGVLPFPEGEPQSLRFTRDGKQLLIGGGRHSHSGCAVLVDIATGARIAKVGDELDIVLAADISPDKQRIALAGPSKIVRIFDTASGELVVEMKKHTDWVFSLRYSPDGVLLATGDRSNGLIVWEADTGRVYSELKGHTGEVRSLDFRADSNVLASGSLDGNIKLWEMAENKEIKSWAAHAGGVSSLMFAHNGLLASAGQDKQVKLWNGNGELQKEFQGLGEAALEVALTGDAAYVAGGDWNGQVQLWPAADPAQTKLIAANPPSIDLRIEQTQAALSAIEAEMSAVETTATVATSQATASQTQLTAAQQTAQSLTDHLNQANTANQLLATDIEHTDASILDLEAQLVAAREKRKELAARKAQNQTQVAALTEQTQSAAVSLTQVQTNHEENSAAAVAAQAQRDSIAAKLVVAQAAADKARADKVALESRAVELKQIEQQTAAEVQTLLTQVNTAEEQQRARQAAAEKLAAEMQALTDQLNSLQMRVTEAERGREQAAKNLETQSQQAAQLKSQLESAEQAALEAQAQLQLFRQAYQSENKLK